MEFGLGTDRIKLIIQNASETVIEMHTAKNNMVHWQSVVEMENLIHTLEQGVQAVEVPQGLHPVDLYYFSQSATKSKMQLLEHKQMVEKKLASLRGYFGSLLVKYRQKAVNIQRGDNMDSNEVIEKILCRFRIVVNQLKYRHSNRNTLTVTDEYDVQDLLHALLKVEFDDVRPEEWIPSYAGGAVRMDFLLKEIDTVIEVKMTRISMTPKSLGEELIIDIEKYRCHPNCKRLYCFVYDPEMRLNNPIGLKNDLESNHEGFLRVIITQ